MIAAIAKEIQLTKPFSSSVKQANYSEKEETINTIYFGGGTPSIINKEEVELLLATVHENFLLDKDAEITLEANPDDITPEKLLMWQNAGINRLSVGVQSFMEEELVWMNRAHTAAESLQSIEDIQTAGFANFSVDLIYGSPLLSDDDWRRNTDIIFEKNIPHISCYALTVEPKTTLDKLISQHKKAPVDAEKQAKQFMLLMQWMETAGYEHYEISNFAKPGMRSKHNSSYWQGKNYFGFGPSAHAFDGKSRQWNIANNALYVQSLKNNIIPFERELLTVTQQLNEYIMTALRTSEGMNLAIVEERFGKDARVKLQLASKKWAAGNKIIIENKTICLTNEGKLFADGIAADLFF